MKTLSQIRELISEKKKHKEEMCDDCGKASKVCGCSDMKEEKELSAKQKKIAAMAGDKDKIDAEDLAKLRSMKKEEVEQVNEGPFSSGALKPTQAMLDKSNSIESHTTFQGKDKKGTYTAKLHRPAGSSDHKEISRVYDTAESVDLDEGGMPSSVIKSKQAREKMSPEDLHAHVKSLQAKGGPVFGGKSVEHIAREMAWSHGHGKMSPHYWDKIKHLEPKNEEVEQVDEVAPPGWEGTVKAMKKHKGIDNPWALAWSMKNKGMKSHKKD